MENRGGTSRQRREPMVGRGREKKGGEEKKEVEWADI